MNYKKLKFYFIFYVMIHFISINIVWAADAEHDKNKKINKKIDSIENNKENKESQKDDNFEREKKIKKKSKFGSVTRFHYKAAIKGESSFTFASYNILPKGFFFLAVYDIFTEKEENNLTDFTNSNLDIYFGRPFSEKSQLGKTFGWVIRYQPLTEPSQTTSCGLQWNISKTPGIRQNNDWKSFIQAYIKEDKGVGTFDFFHWYQFYIIDKKISIRGNNSVYIIPNKEDGIRLVQDLIFHLNDQIDLYLRHFYQNISDIDENRSTGSQFLIGIRIMPFN